MGKIGFRKNKDGFGLFSENYGGRTLWGHTGRQVSYISYAFMDIQTGHSFVLLTNNANDKYVGQIMDKLCTKNKEKWLPARAISNNGKAETKKESNPNSKMPGEKK